MGTCRNHHFVLQGKGKPWPLERTLSFNEIDENKRNNAAQYFAACKTIDD